MAAAATAHALKLGETAVAAEVERQAHSKEQADTLSAHSVEMERVRQVDKEPCCLDCFSLDLMHTGICIHQKQIYSRLKLLHSKRVQM